MQTATQARHRRIASGKISLATQSRGDESRPTIVLVHGYPDNSAVWDAAAEYLASDYHVVTYDVRGAGASDAPKRTRDYAYDFLVDDLIAVAEDYSPNRAFHLVGHDLGALQTWEAVLSGRLTGRLASFTTMAPAVDHVGFWFRRRLQKPTPKNLMQFASRLLGSSYMAAFQLPVLPELLWSAGMDRVFPRFLETFENIKAEPSATLAADGKQGLAFYRTNLIKPLLFPRARITEVPVQLLMMTRDRFVPAAMFEGVEEWAPNLQRREMDAGHWGMLLKPQEFAKCVADFVATTEEAIEISIKPKVARRTAKH